MGRGQWGWRRDDGDSRSRAGKGGIETGVPGKEEEDEGSAKVGEEAEEWIERGRGRKGRARKSKGRCRYACARDGRAQRWEGTVEKEE
jgi:hypothetical protein